MPVHACPMVVSLQPTELLELSDQRPVFGRASCSSVTLGCTLVMQNITNIKHT